MNGGAQINDFTNTNVSFTNIERFNATFGSGNDVIVLLGGNDIINGGGGNDSLNTAAGAAVVDGGTGGMICGSPTSPATRPSRTSTSTLRACRPQAMARPMSILNG